MKNATLRQLRVFSSVARHSSFARAAEELGLTAPAVSMQIKELETEVGLPLFDRTSRKVSLTMVGEYVLAYTQRVLGAMRGAGDMGTRAALDEFMDAYQMTPRVIMQMSSNEAIKQAVMAGMGISLLSLHTIGLELDLRLIAAPETEGLPVMRRWHVVHTQAKTLSPPAEAFRYFMLENAEAYLAQHFRQGNELVAENAAAQE